MNAKSAVRRGPAADSAELSPHPLAPFSRHGERSVAEGTCRRHRAGAAAGARAGVDRLCSPSTRSFELSENLPQICIEDGQKTLVAANGTFNAAC